MLLPLALAQGVAALRAPQLPGPAAATNATKRGKVSFLMLAEDGIMWESIWVNFFEGGQNGVDYQAFIHCTHSKECRRENVKRQDIFNIIPTVPSVWCKDLVSPMMALLRVATRHSQPGNPYDKFVFVSHNSLPVKPFWLAHKMLTEGQEGMATFRVPNPKGCGLFKASQWCSISHVHAQRMLDVQEEEGLHFDEHLAAYPKGCQACMDENVPIASAFGGKSLARYPSEFPPDLRNQGIMWLAWNAAWTPKMFSSPSNRTDETAVELERSGEGSTAPVTYGNLSADFISLFRASPEIIFMRKVDKATHFAPSQNGGKITLSARPLPQAWNELVFSK